MGFHLQAEDICFGFGFFSGVSYSANTGQGMFPHSFSF